MCTCAGACIEADGWSPSAWLHMPTDKHQVCEGNVSAFQRLVQSALKSGSPVQKRLPQNQDMYVCVCMSLFIPLPLCPSPYAPPSMPLCPSLYTVIDLSQYSPDQLMETDRLDIIPACPFSEQENSLSPPVTEPPTTKKSRKHQ